MDLVELFPQERVQRRTLRHFVDVPVLQILDETARVLRLVPRERVQQQIDEQSVELHTLWKRTFLDAVMLVSQKCVRQLHVHMVEVLVPEIMEGTVGEFKTA